MTIALEEDLSEQTLADIDRRLDAELFEEVARGIELDAPSGRFGAHADVLLSPTVWKFVCADADVNVIYAARREGKTVGGITRLLRVAQSNPQAQPLVVGCVRDTWTNLQRTTIHTIKEGHARGWWDAVFSESETQCVLNGGEVRIFLFGMDRQADANKFQGFEMGVLWIEEPAPAADFASGVPADVFGIGVTSLSQRGFKPSVQITMNPPDSDHWTVNLVDTLLEKNHADMTIATFWIVPGENRHLPPGYRSRMKLALEAIGRFDLVQRLVEGRIHDVKDGEPVTPEFRASGPLSHIASGPVEIHPRWPSYRFWDFGLNPTVVYAQATPMGNFNVFGALVGENMGIEEFIPKVVIPWQAKFGIQTQPASRPDTFGRALAPRWKFRDIGDPAGKNREQSSSERSAKKALDKALRTELELGPVDWPARRDSLKYVLTQVRGDRPLVQFDPEECKPLIKALRGRWRYAKTSSGVVSRIPIKDIHSHSGDAFGYGMAALFPAHEFLKRALEEEKPPPMRPLASTGGWLGR